MYISTPLSLTIPRVGFYISPAAKHCFHCPTADTSCAGLFLSNNFLSISGSKEERRRDMWFNILLWVGSVLKSFDTVDHLPGQKHTITSTMLVSALGTRPWSRTKEWEEEKQFWINSTSSSVCLCGEKRVKPPLRFTLFPMVCARPAINQSSLFPPFFSWEPLQEYHAQDLV